MMFGIADNLNELIPQMKSFWYKPVLSEVGQALKKALPGLDITSFSNELLATFSKRDKVHIDAWMKVQQVNGYNVVLSNKSETHNQNDLKLYFVNLGGYKTGEFEEYHKKLFVVANGVSDVKAQILSHPFMKEYSPSDLGTAGKGHIDDQHKIDFEADDIICINEILGNNFKVILKKADTVIENETKIGYVPLSYKD